MTIRQVADNIYRISLAWSNAYVLREGRSAALIDCGLQKDRPALLAGLGELGLAPPDIQTLLLTHGHCDHAGSAAFFAMQGAQIIAHSAESRFLEPPRRSYAPRGLNALRRPLTALAFEIGEALYPVERCPITRKVEDGNVIAAPGGPLRVVHCPGHTPGHIAFYREQDKILFSGDCVLNIIPFARVTGLSLPIRMLSDDWKQARQSLFRLAWLSPRLLLSGHGLPLSDDTANALFTWAEARSVTLISAFRGKNE